MRKWFNRKNERGAIVVEATISLTAFMFAFFILYSIVDICYVQAKVGMALNSAAKDISEYSYLYYKFGVDKAQSSLHEGTDESRSNVEDTISAVGKLTSGFTDGRESIDLENGTVDFDALKGAAETMREGASDLSSNINTYADALAEDPKGFMLGMAKLAADEGSGMLNSVIGQAMAKGFMKCNLKASSDGDVDAFLQHFRVRKGMKGMDFSGTQLMTYGATDDIQLVCNYQVKVLTLLNNDINISFCQCAKTKAWGNGQTKISEVSSEDLPDASDEKTVWDLYGPTDRGKIIVSCEQDKYTYIDKYHGFDAYDNADGANEFISICSLDTHTASYSNSNNIRYYLNQQFSKMDKSVSKMGEEVSVQKHDGTKTTVHSDPDTRTYKMVLVVPADSDMAMVQKAVDDFIQKQSEAGHNNIVVEINTDYGSPSASSES